MGKRSDFDRQPRDFYPTPVKPVQALLPYLEYATFDEPCAGNGALVRHLLAAGHVLGSAYDIEPQADWIHTGDALNATTCESECFITNPPWRRDILHPLITRLSDIAPTWLLIDAGWLFTLQSAPFMERVHKIVAVGRVKWIPDSPHTGKDDAVWILIDKPNPGSTEFIGRAPR